MCWRSRRHRLILLSEIDGTETGISFAVRTNFENRLLSPNEIVIMTVINTENGKIVVKI